MVENKKKAYAVFLLSIFTMGWEVSLVMLSELGTTAILSFAAFGTFMGEGTAISALITGLFIKIIE